jgi:hypothetical protein
MEQFEAAIELTGKGRDIVDSRNDAFDGADRALENALLEQEMIALALSGYVENAITIASLLEQSDDVRPEVVVAGAFVRAYVDQKRGVSGVERFNTAIDRLQRTSLGNASITAQINLMRGKLLEQIGGVQEALGAYAVACEREPYNMHMLQCYRRLLETSIRRNPPERAALVLKLERINSRIEELRPSSGGSPS